MLLPPGGNVIEILKDHGRFGKFVELVEFAGLTEELEGSEEGTPITVLAPTDGAMDNLRDEFKEKIMEDAEDAAVFVRHHVIKVLLNILYVLSHIECRVIGVYGWDEYGLRFCKLIELVS